MADTPEPTTSELIDFFAEKHAELKTLKVQVVQLEAIIEGLEEMMLERLPPGVEQMSHTTPTGTKVSVKAKVTERFQPAAGQSDAFWGWVQKNQQWSMTSRTVLQAGVKTYLAEHGALPPGIEVASKTTAGVTVTIGAPRA